MYPNITSNTDTKKHCAYSNHERPDSNANSQKLEHEIIPWTTTKINEEFVTQLALASVYTKDEQSGFTLVLFKYYEKAAYLMYRIPVYRPTPSFDIHLSDLSPRLKRELVDLKRLDPRMFRLVTKLSVGSIFENLDFAYFHRSVMRHLKIRFLK